MYRDLYDLKALGGLPTPNLPPPLVDVETERLRNESNKVFTEFFHTVVALTGETLK